MRCYTMYTNTLTKKEKLYNFMITIEELNIKYTKSTKRKYLIK